MDRLINLGVLVSFIEYSLHLRLEPPGHIFVYVHWNRTKISWQVLFERNFDSVIVSRIYWKSFIGKGWHYYCCDLRSLACWWDKRNYHPRWRNPRCEVSSSCSASKTNPSHLIFVYRCSCATASSFEKQITFVYKLLD